MANESAVPGSAVPGSVSPGSPTSAATSSWPGYYTYNFCPDPSAEYGITGYTPLLGTETVTQSPGGYSGQWSVSVTTPGSVPGEGVAAPVGTILASVTGSASISVQGNTGSLTITAVDDGVVLGSIPVVLSGSWQRVQLDNLAMNGGDPFQLLIQTTTPQAITFFIDAVQYEPESPAHPYIDGDQPNCAWSGTPGYSPSYQEYQNPLTLAGGCQLEGTINFIAQGEIFIMGNADPSAGPVVLIEGILDISGDEHPMAAVTEPGRTVIPPAIDTGIDGLPWEIAGGGSISGLIIINPPGGIGSFGIWETGTDPDPAMTLIGQNNAGTKSGQEDYTLIYGQFTPPKQVLDSAGNALWQAAAYMAAGFRISSLSPYVSNAEPNAVNFCDIQIEKLPTSGTPVPSAYQYPRALSTIVKPTNMNFVTNPGFQVSDADWTATGGASLAIDTAHNSGVKPAASGTQSLQVSGTGTPGTEITITDLIAGDQYVLSAYVAAFSDNISDIILYIANDSAGTTSFGDPFYGGDSVYPGYGQGPYGGVLAANTALPVGTWYRPNIIFTATASTLTLSITTTPVTGGSGTVTFDLDAVMISPGQVLSDYADGNSDEWQWELGGTPGLSRSYYYERQQVAANSVQNVLNEHIPLGISAYAPVYAQPYTQ